MRERAFDCGEIAIVTFLQAKSSRKPLALLPASIVGRFQQNALHYNPERGTLAASGLNGKRIGVGSYTTTTGVWVRGVLQHDYGVDPAGVTWIVVADAHLAEFKDPPNVRKAGADKKLDEMLLDGEIDALISPRPPADSRVKQLIPDAAAAGRAWGEKNGTVQINHAFAVDTDLLAQRPDVVKEVLACYRRGAPRVPRPRRCGRHAALRRSGPGRRQFDRAIRVRAEHRAKALHRLTSYLARPKRESPDHSCDAGRNEVARRRDRAARARSARSADRECYTTQPDTFCRRLAAASRKQNYERVQSPPRTVRRSASSFGTAQLRSRPPSEV